MISAILAGALIGLGGIANLTSDSAVFGAIVFSVGLYAVCLFDLSLYTGRVSYIVQTKDPHIFVVLAGNLIGAWLMGWALRLSGLSYRDVTAAKLDRSPLAWFVLAVLCNICIYIAVEGYRAGHPLALIFAVTVFVSAGFEHSIADMFYFTVSGWSWRAVGCMAVVIAGNAAGGMAVHNGRRLT